MEKMSLFQRFIRVLQRWLRSWEDPKPVELPLPPEPEHDIVTLPGIGKVFLGAWITGEIVRFGVPDRFRDTFLQVQKETGVDASLLYAIAWQESNIDPGAIATNRGPPVTKDWGMMQINDINLSRFGLSQTRALDPTENVRAAARLILEIRKRHTNVPDILSIYNAGTSNEQGQKHPFTFDVRRNRFGAYINARYVREVMGRLMMVRISNLAVVGNVVKNA